MATFKAEVYAHQKRADGTWNIKIRVTHQKRKKYLATPYYVYKEDLTRTFKLKNQHYIDECDKMIRKYRSVCERLGERINKMDAFTAALNGYDRIDEKGKRHIVGLKKIGYLLGVADLEFYSARHSWATIAINFVGVDKFSVHTALNHVDEKMKVTDLYVKKSWDPIDQANRKVLDFIKLDIGSVEEPMSDKMKKIVLLKQNM